MSIVVGSVAFDTIETKFGRRERIVGGSALYFSYSASLFENPKIVAVVGEDFPQNEIESMIKKGIDVKGLKILKGKTFFWEGKYSDDFNTRETIVTELNVFEKFHPQIPEEYLNDRFVFLANISPELQLEVLEQTKDIKDRVVIMDTMNLWINIAKDKLLEVLKNVDIFILNDEEAELLVGEKYAVEAAYKIQEKGPSCVIVKKGAHGSLVLFEDKMFIFPPYPVRNVVDPTGAGDTYAGGFVGYLSKVNKVELSSLKKAIVYGTIVSSFTIEDFGVERIKKLKIEEVEERVVNYKKMLEF